mmetsp:Transcript_60846/g.188986  ORF Transcript_60846/g.188986 Transcript_60846/m.188986 type:complete len:216 (+) Transcript_60846:211-858(+)
MTRSVRRRTSRESLRPTTYCGTPRSARRMTSSAKPPSAQARRVRAARGAPMLRAAGACPRRRRSASSAPFSVAETVWRASLGATRALSSFRQTAAWPAEWLAAKTCPSVAHPCTAQPSAACPSALGARDSAAPLPAAAVAPARRRMLCREAQRLSLGALARQRSTTGRQAWWSLGTRPRAATRCALRKVAALCSSRGTSRSSAAWSWQAWQRSRS